jgi:hypothetical protein
MKMSSVQLNDLPDEILLKIFQNLDNTTLLYSLSGINRQLNDVVHDSIFTSCLILLTIISDRSKKTIVQSISLSNPIIDRFCLQILPNIHEKIKWLHLEPSSMNRILDAANYPNLSAVSLYNIPADAVVDLFSSKISHLNSIRNVCLRI